MIHTSHILALSQPGFVLQQVRTVFSGGDSRGQRRDSFWRGWGFPEA